MGRMGREEDHKGSGWPQREEARTFLDSDCEEGVKDPVGAGLVLIQARYKKEFQSDKAICPGLDRLQFCLDF